MKRLKKMFEESWEQDQPSPPEFTEFNGREQSKHASRIAAAAAYIKECYPEQKTLDPKNKEILNDKLVGYNDMEIDSDTGTPFNAEETKRIIDWFNKNPQQTKYKRNNTFPKLSIVKVENNGVPEYMIIYRGTKFKDSWDRKKDTTFKTFLGKGSFGRVKLAQNLQTSEVLAAKIFSTRSMPQDDLATKLREEKILKSKGELHGTANNSTQYKDKEYLIMNFKEGITLESYLVKSELDDLTKLQAILSAFKATKKLHGKKIIHGDLSFRNIFYNPETKESEPIDFGFADIADKESYIELPFKISTSPYHPPECASKIHYYASDVFSLGYWLSRHIKTFKDSYIREQLNLLVHNMTLKEPTRRLTIDKAIIHLSSLEEKPKSQYVPVHKSRKY